MCKSTVDTSTINCQCDNGKPPVDSLVMHCRPDYLQWEQRATCIKCAHPLADNPLVKDAYKMNTVNAHAKQQLNILADMAEHRGMQWFADEARKIAGELLHL
jgi:hypothetical protein